MNETMKGLGDPIEELENVNVPGIKQEVVKDEICEEELPDLPNYVTIKDEVVIDKLDIVPNQDVHKTHSGQFAKSECSDGDNEETKPLKIKTECEFEEFDQPDQIPVEDIDSILFEGTKTKVKSEFGSTEDSNEPTDGIFEKDSTSHLSSIKTLFKCEVCDKGYANKAVKNRHMRVHFGKSPVPCTVCGKEFEKSVWYIQHYGKHLEESYRYHCQDCDKKFASRGNLNEHRASHHNANRKGYACRYCSKDFPNRSDLLGHESLHNGKQLFQCPICQKNFAKAFELNEHRRAHAGLSCDKSITQRDNLKRHETSDEEAIQFECTLCSKTFKKKDSLKKHKSTHELAHVTKSKRDVPVKAHPKKPFECNMCDKQFEKKKNLKMHLRVHSDERFSCKVCSKEFPSSKNIKRHMLTHSDVDKR